MKDGGLGSALARTLGFWFRGVRVYIAIASLLISLVVWMWAQAAFGGNPTLVLIRIEEAYAWISVGFLATALSVGPVFKLFPNSPGKGQWFDARRLLGISAAYFASLHVVFVSASETSGGGVSLSTFLFNPQAILGLIALLMLLALVATSFDKAIKTMGVWWFRLHRLIYAASFLALLHAFMIGAHATSIGPLMVVIALATALVILHICVALGRQKASRWQWLTIVLAALLLIAVSNYGVQRYVERVIIINGHTHQ